MICNMICKRENSTGCDCLAGGDPYPTRFDESYDESYDESFDESFDEREGKSM